MGAVGGCPWPFKGAASLAQAQEVQLRSQLCTLEAHLQAPLACLRCGRVRRFHEELLVFAYVLSEEVLWFQYRPVEQAQQKGREDLQAAAASQLGTDRLITCPRRLSLVSDPLTLRNLAAPEAGAVPLRAD